MTTSILTVEEVPVFKRLRFTYLCCKNEWNGQFTSSESDKQAVVFNKTQKAIERIYLKVHYKVILYKKSSTHPDKQTGLGGYGKIIFFTCSIQEIINLWFHMNFLKYFFKF